MNGWLVKVRALLRRLNDWADSPRPSEPEIPKPPDYHEIRARERKAWRAGHRPWNYRRPGFGAGSADLEHMLETLGPADFLKKVKEKVDRQR